LWFISGATSGKFLTADNSGAGIGITITAKKGAMHMAVGVCTGPSDMPVIDIADASNTVAL
jgi:hypothetical protein